MRFVNQLLVFLGIALFSIGCATQHKDIVVGSFGKYDIKLSEFEKAYSKNVGGEDVAKKDSLEQYKKFLDLYLNYKMKLRDAEVRDYPNDVDIYDEIETYRKSVGKSFLIERNVMDKGLKTLFENRKVELRVSHIMIKADENGLPAAKEKAQGIIDRINNGESFDELAAQYSDDQFSKNKGGDIYYVTGGQINIPEFEDAIFATKEGEIYPEPVNTRYGYHVVKVTERNPRIYKIRASHILLDYKNEGGKIDTLNAEQTISAIQKRLEKGESFASLAKQFSEDPGSGKKGGDLGFFERRMMVQEFDDTVFKLKVGEISEPVYTRFGIHLIQLNDIQDFPSFEDSKKDLKPMYERYRKQYDLDNYIESLRTKFQYQIDEKAIEDIASLTDTAEFRHFAASKVKDEVGEKAVFTIGSEKYSFEKVVDFVKDLEALYQKKMTVENIKNAVGKYSQDVLLLNEVEGLESTNEEFAGLMQEYKSGIYIFKVQEEEVWDKIAIDSTDIKKYWEETKASYMTEDQVEFRDIFITSDSLAKFYHKMLLDGEDFEVVAKKYSESKKLKTKGGYHGIVPVSNNNLSLLAWKLKEPGTISEPLKIQNGWSIIQLIQRYPKREKTFDEAKAEVASKLQDLESKRLEKEYISRLKSIYEPELNYDELEKAYKNKTAD